VSAGPFWFGGKSGGEGASWKRKGSNAFLPSKGKGKANFMSFLSMKGKAAFWGKGETGFTVISERNPYRPARGGERKRRDKKKKGEAPFSPFLQEKGEKREGR